MNKWYVVTDPTTNESRAVVLTDKTFEDGYSVDEVLDFEDYAGSGREQETSRWNG